MKKISSGQKQLQLLPLLVIIYHKHVYCNCLSEKKNCYVIAHSHVQIKKGAVSTPLSKSSLVPSFRAEYNDVNTHLAVNYNVKKHFTTENKIAF